MTGYLLPILEQLFELVEPEPCPRHSSVMSPESSKCFFFFNVRALALILEFKLTLFDQRVTLQFLFILKVHSDVFN